MMFTSATIVKAVLTGNYVQSRSMEEWFKEMNTGWNKNQK